MNFYIKKILVHLGVAADDVVVGGDGRGGEGVVGGVIVGVFVVVVEEIVVDGSGTFLSGVKTSGRCCYCSE